MFPIVAALIILLVLFAVALVDSVSEGDGDWREPVSVVLGFAITALELFAINLVLDVRSYRLQDWPRSLSAFLILLCLWAPIAADVLRLHHHVPRFVSVNLLVLSICLVILAGVAVFAVIARMVRRARNPEVAAPRPRISRMSLGPRIAAAAGLVAVLLAATEAVSALVPRSGPNDAVAIGWLRQINSGQAEYASTCAGGGYAIDLADLIKPSPGQGRGFIPPELRVNGVVKSGYVITLAKNGADVQNIGTAAATCNGSVGQPVSSYFASATPAEPGRTGWRYYATDSRGTIYVSTMRPIANPIIEGPRVRVLQ
jgi:hypothetical protein